jgi:hypothetical protein
MTRKLPIPPVLAVIPARMPLSILLALPESVTNPKQEGMRAPVFNLAGAVNVLLGDWYWSDKVMSPSIWAPGWDAQEFRNFIYHSHPKPRNIPQHAVDGFRLSEFPVCTDCVTSTENRKYDILHYVGDSILRCVGNSIIAGDPFLDFGNGRYLAAGALRDALVSAGTRLLVLQVPPLSLDLQASIKRYGRGYTIPLEDSNFGHLAGASVINCC